MQHNHIVRGVAFSPGPHPAYLATGGFEKKLRIYDMSTAGNSNTVEEVVPVTDPGCFEVGAGVHEGTIKSVIWTPDPNVLVTAADDKKLRWFDVRATGVIQTYNLDAIPSSCELNVNPSGEAHDEAVLSVAAGKTAYFFSGTTPGSLRRA